MINKGYQPNKGELDSLKPPREGSGVSRNASKLLKYKVLRFKKDDIIIINIKEAICTTEQNAMIYQLKKVFPNNRLLILADGATLSIMRDTKKIGEN